ncbi:P-loop containing nucleoside triphosphate hydrolase protein [Irpex lacteus]|nr:P-loop containing nucleoside triphosphate hydrolase protein [Irpex lacteus]
MAPRDDDTFVIVRTQDGPVHSNASSKDPMYAPWGEQTSAINLDPPGQFVRKLKELYPKHSVTQFAYVNLLGFPGAFVQPISPPDIITSVNFLPVARGGQGQGSGVLVDDVKFGAFRVAWDKYDFILYVVKVEPLYSVIRPTSLTLISVPLPTWEDSRQFLLHEGPDQPSRALIAKAGIFNNALHEEIYVFDSGYWFKDHNLWVEAQKANWDDVILKDEFKTTLQKDVFGFFDSEELYKSLGIPWKRGIIMHGPPGNGKTISMKAIMKDADAKGYYPLYVKSFRSWKGEEGAMVDVFEKARQVSPCVLILEDLDSLINDRNRSFFLNQLDGLESNDGILIIGTTNHLDRIDPALSTRPSRFDRKFLFDDPDKVERKLYAQYWQDKLKSNKSIDFPDSCFAYLKEAFVSTLVLLAGDSGDKDKHQKRTFADVLRDQIQKLRKQLDSSKPSEVYAQDPNVPGAWRQYTAFPSTGHGQNAPQQGRVDRRLANQTRIWDTGANSIGNGSDFGVGMQMPGEMPAQGRPGRDGAGPRDDRDMRAVAGAAARLGRSFIF